MNQSAPGAQHLSVGFVRRLAGSLVLGVGVLIAIFPFLSVWQISQQILGELPDNPAGSVIDGQSRFGMAIFDGDFVLATRGYENASLQDVESALAGSGFERATIGGTLWWIKDCCGEYDAAMVDLVENDGAVVATVTAYDSDVQATWAIFPVFGLIVGFVGALLYGRRSERSSPGSGWSDDARASSESGLGPVEGEAAVK